jgi:CheY-like chemotaxis protein
VIVTTKDQETDRVWGKRQGARDYLTKPLTKHCSCRPSLVSFPANNQKNKQAIWPPRDSSNFSKLPSVPDSAPYMLGYFNRVSSLQEHRRRLLVIDQGDVFSGLVVDEILGMQHFPVQDYSSEALHVHAELRPFVQGAFRRDDKDWAIFSLARLVEDPQFLQASA